MEKKTDHPEQGKIDKTSAPIAAAALGIGSLALIPSLLILFVLAAVSFYGVRFVWQLVQILAS